MRNCFIRNEFFFFFKKDKKYVQILSIKIEQNNFFKLLVYLLIKPGLKK